MLSMFMMASVMPVSEQMDLKPLPEMVLEIMLSGIRPHDAARLYLELPGDRPSLGVLHPRLKTCMPFFLSLKPAQL